MFVIIRMQRVDHCHTYAYTQQPKQQVQNLARYKKHIDVFFFKSKLKSLLNAKRLLFEFKKT